MRTTIQSDSTVVPPVTAERSPPASRMTGADSPVTAASLTEAMPSMTSPSPGMMSPADDQHKSPGRRSSAETVSDTRSRSLRIDASRLAVVVGARAAQAIGLGTAAALGDGLGEVGEQHGEPQPGGDLAS